MTQAGTARVLRSSSSSAPGYPGSTYVLIYDPKGDQIAGVYSQGALQQSFDVVIVRLK